MPLILDRRSFLKRAAGAAGVAVVSRLALADNAKSEIHWALLSDIHIAANQNDVYRGFHPHENLRRVLDQVAATQFDSMLINGDLARQEGKPQDYAAIAGYVNPLAEKMPLLITMGNHDDRKNARSGIANFSGDVQPVERKLVTTLDTSPVGFILLDSLMATNIAAGQLGRAQREWLKDEIAAIKKPTVIFVHHNLDANDDNALVDATRFLDMLRPARQVKAVLFGHTHAWHYEEIDGLHLVNIPAVGYNFKDSEPVGWVEATFTPGSASLKLHAIGGNTNPKQQSFDIAWRR